MGSADSNLIEPKFDAALQEGMTSASVATSRSSRKRAREIAWCDVTNVSIPDTEFNTPQHFMEMNSIQQDHFLNRLGFDEQEKCLVKVKLQEALQSKPLPSPSNMTWPDAEKILHGTLPKSLPVKEPPNVNSTAVTDDCLKHLIKELESKFKRRKEGEVMVRVFLMTLIAVSGVGNVMVEIQPSLDAHPTFTDFLINITDENKKVRFIEVKNARVAVDLSNELETTAQVLREAHILLSTNTASSPLKFAITNGRTWSFAVAEKHASTKVKLLQVYHMTIANLESLDEWKRMANILRDFFCGTFPSVSET